MGLLVAGFAENLETGPASTSLLQAAGVARLITVTGGVSFLTGRTFHQLLHAAREPGGDVQSDYRHGVCATVRRVELLVVLDQLGSGQGVHMAIALPLFIEPVELAGFHWCDGGARTSARTTATRSSLAIA